MARYVRSERGEGEEGHGAKGSRASVARHVVCTHALRVARWCLVCRTPLLFREGTVGRTSW